MEWLVWITWWFLLSVRYSRLYRERFSGKNKDWWKCAKSWSGWGSFSVILTIVWDIIYPFMHNKSYAYLLSVEPSNLVFFQTYKTDFDGFIIKFHESKL